MSGKRKDYAKLRLFYNGQKLIEPVISTKVGIHLCGRKFLSILMLPLVTLFVLIACNGSAQNEQQPEYVWNGRSPSAQNDNPTKINAWILIEDLHTWPADILIKATESTQEHQIETEILGKNYNNSEYLQQLNQAIESGNAPDIAFISRRNDIIRMASEGLLSPIDDCLAKYSAFDHVVNSLWEQVSWQGKIWAVPVAAGVKPLYFNIGKLRTLGWSQKQIEELPARIEKGEFTLNDLIATAKSAIATGMVEPGFGIWQRPGMGISLYYAAFGGQILSLEQNKLLINESILAQTYAFQQQLIDEDIVLPFVMEEKQNTWSSRAIWHDAVTHNRVLFWIGHSADWGNWATNYVDHLGGQAYLDKSVGYALIPSASVNTPGTTDFFVKSYVILADEAANYQRQDAACAVLAQTVMSDINGTHSAESGLMAVSRPELMQPIYNSSQFATETQTMFNYAWILPNPVDFDVETYISIISEFVEKVQSGELLPEEAAAATVQRLRITLGDELIVE